ncbi:hypothetical protein MXM49_26030, partial [Klebsiella quasipneumoniae]|nr:hypothetical protein [Klebsiella quasipneumoniae]
GLLTLASSGELKSRQDVTEALERSGFEVVRTTKNSISIADPDVGSALSGEQRRPEVSYTAAGDANRSHPLRRDDMDPPETGV